MQMLFLIQVVFKTGEILKDKIEYEDWLNELPAY